MRAHTFHKVGFLAATASDTAPSLLWVYARRTAAHKLDRMGGGGGEGGHEQENTYMVIWEQAYEQPRGQALMDHHVSTLADTRMRARASMCAPSGCRNMRSTSPYCDMMCFSFIGFMYGGMELK